MDKKILTLCIVHQNGQVLLGMKKRGLGQGLWNGFGGKVQAGESIEQAAIRECQEEACILPERLERKGKLSFSFDKDPVQSDVHVFYANAFSGEPQETEEMRPRWFSSKEIPYQGMWPDDKYWLPLLLEGKSFKGSFIFGDGNTILWYAIREI